MDLSKYKNLIDKFYGVIGFGLGVLIVIFSVIVFAYDANTVFITGLDNDKLVSPAYEEDQAYGGDAYTGMQQAAAQAANNLIPVFNAIKKGNEYTTTLNNNAARIVKAIKISTGFILLTVGLLTMFKYLGAFITAFTEKKTVAAESGAAVNIPVSAAPEKAVPETSAVTDGV